MISGNKKSAADFSRPSKGKITFPSLKESLLCLPTMTRPVQRIIALAFAAAALILPAPPAFAPPTNGWSLQPLRRPAPPKLAAADAKWARSPVDAFIVARLKAKQLTPSPEADRRTLIRRVYFDLVGLPPTPSEVAAFIADKNPLAYEALVDKLLASPRHGERWARHWMDAVHFAETHGHDQDRIRPNAWPYRDYLIGSFNGDKPYARFVQEQVAADTLFPDEPHLAPALGMLAAGPWDESSLRDIREDTLDREIARYIDRDDIVATVMSTFASSTVHCARCHDHKFDPISQLDYYNLQSVFAGVGRGDVSFEDDPKIHQVRRAWLDQQAALQRRDKSLLDTLLAPALQAEVSEWEKKIAAHGVVVWTVLEPASANSAEGATLTKQPDHSILSSGKRPEKDTYTILADTELRGATAVRLEVLADDSLPHKGPGRQDNGNLHLSEFQVRTAPRARTNESKATSIAHATADFDQAGWTLQHAIDGQPATAWGIYPQVGKSHHGIFELKENVGHEGGTRWTFTLEQKHGGGHLIGRPRISITTAPRPVRASPLPGDIAKALAVPAAARSDDQKRELTLHFLKEKVTKALAALPAPQRVFVAAGNFLPDGSHRPVATPRPVHLLKRGEITKPGELATPGALSSVTAIPARFNLPKPDAEGDRRAALARWLSHPDNPLTWRSAVNRVWHHHFGRGLVDTPNDFGRMGGLPSHPELLDWLAVEFRDGSGSMKKLHRLIVTSAVYRQSSQHKAQASQVDADNRLLWRQNRTRLDAESLRDAVLQIAGRLDLRMGGPSDQQFAVSPGIHVTPNVDYNKFDWDSPAARRRSVYRFIFRTLPDPFMDALDCPDASLLTPVRTHSVDALQALALLNDAFILRQSEHFSTRVAADAKSLDEQIAAACQLAFARTPDKMELKIMSDYATRHGLANLCRLLLNSNEFLFLD